MRINGQQSLFPVPVLPHHISPLPLCVVSTQMLAAVCSSGRFQATMELQLSVSASSAQEASPLPHPAFL